MTPPVRWRDDATIPDERRALVRSAAGSRPLPKEVRSRSAGRIDRLIVVPAAAWLIFWIKGVAAAGLCALGVAAAVHVVPALTRRVVLAATPRPMRSGSGPRPAAAARSQSPNDPMAAPGASAPLEAADPFAAHGSFGAPAGELSGASAPLDAADPFAAHELSGAVPPPRGPAAASMPSELHAPLGAHAPSAPPSPHSSDLDRVPHQAGAEPPSLWPTMSDSLAREAAMLEDARGILDRNPSGALAVLDRHASMFPAGSLAIERELLGVEALRRLRRFTEARARGDALLARARGSIYEERVHAILAALPSP